MLINKSNHSKILRDFRYKPRMLHVTFTQAEVVCMSVFIFLVRKFIRVCIVYDFCFIHSREL